MQIFHVSRIWTYKPSWKAFFLQIQWLEIYAYNTLEGLITNNSDHTSYLRRFVEKAGTTSTIQKVMILFDITLSELLRKIIPVRRKAITGYNFSLSCLYVSLKLEHC